jgi:hypothetical protein
MLAAELAEEALGFLPGLDLSQGFFLLREDRRVCEYEPFLCCCPPCVSSGSEYVELAVT